MNFMIWGGLNGIGMVIYKLWHPLTVYGVEVIATLLERIKLKENIFEAHRRHLYQLFANEKKISHLIISGVYAAIQIMINAMVIILDLPQWIMFAIVLIPLVFIYFYLKFSVKKAIVRAEKSINN